jgi:hypothetical protein
MRHWLQPMRHNRKLLSGTRRKIPEQRSGRNMYILCHVLVTSDRLWSSGQSSCLQIEKSGFDFRLYQRSSESRTGFTQPREFN